MIRFRKLLFWTHLTAGTLAGLVILVMSITGAVLALKPQIQNWVDRDIRYVTPQGEPLSAWALLSAVKAARPDVAPQSLALDREPSIAALVSLGGRDGNVYVNPYTGAILGAQSRATSEFFQAMTTWHRYMGASGENRSIGRSATGASNLAFSLLGLSGLYLWWPKQLSAKFLRPIVWFRSTSTGKARDFNWHNTIGFWSLVPILVMTVSGIVMSYTWGNNLVYRLTGSPVPAARGGGPGSAAAEGRGAEARPSPGRAGERGGGEGERRGGDERSAVPIVPVALDLVLARAAQQIPTWSQLTLRLPTREGGAVAFTIVDGAQWNEYARSQLTLNGATGDVVQWQPYADQSLGQKARGWLRFAHTGELGGLTGQLVAGIGCLGGVFLVYTGLSLAFRRLWNWSLWKRQASAPAPARSAVVRESLMDQP